jgi:hypothetical protein
MLSECTFPSRGQRWGFVPFRALCVAEGLAAHERLTPCEAMRVLQQLADELGGEVVEEECCGCRLTRSGTWGRRTNTSCCSLNDIASRARMDSVRDREGAVAPHDRSRKRVCAQSSSQST